MNDKSVSYYIGQIIAWIIIVIIFIACILIIYHIQDIFKSIIDILAYVGKIDVVIIVAIIGALATFIVNLISKQSDHKFEINKYLSSKRQESYEDFIKIFFDLLESQDNPKENIPKRLNEFKQTLILYGSKRTYNAFENYWKCLNKKDDNATVILDMMEKVVSEMRRDMRSGYMKKSIISNIIRNDLIKK